MPKILLFLSFTLATHALFAQKALTKKYSSDECHCVIDNAAGVLETSQPGVYRYHSKAEFKRYLDSVKATVKGPMTELELYRKLKPLVTRIGCLHTDLITGVNYKGWLDRSPNLLPFQLYCEGSRAFVVKNYSADKSIAPGDEILAINGRSMPDVLKLLLPTIPADGYNQTMKYLALYHMFPSWYRSIIEVADTFALTVKHNSTEKVCVVPAAKKKDIAQDGFLEEFSYPKQLAFKVTGNTGFLTIHTFANSVIKKGDQRFKEFIDKTFEELQAKGIPNLVVDLRYNTGGSDVNAAYFSGFFFDEPYRYWDRIEVTDKIAKKIKGVVRIWYRKPVQQDSAWLWQKGKTVKDFDFFEVQQPSPNHYKGNVYVLINGFCMSSCADVTSVLSCHKKAVFIGEETGGGYQGNNSGLMPGVNLRPTKMVLTVPLQEYFTAVDPKVNFGRGTMPDYPVKMTVDDIVKGEDKPMEVAMELINGQSKQHDTVVMSSRTFIPAR
ncbi:hypothetical protein HHL17_20355 [Chitinophaga sp. G-6-1-13]|uniref:Tail specific protease domain-containing protein n=1 Tax=Chitinophaga fulva TaxID=2728842 RepID=A0A848GLT2_9BACT|nr:S41 family peptidase [Chitinophaga fulva]NML39565.1 hypothetical protein [Chitinophaga fulva]